MLSILRTLGPSYLDTRFARRTWVVSSGDGFSAARAEEFEGELEVLREKTGGGNGTGDRKGGDTVNWDIVTVRRARRVHQSLLTTPVSAVGCLVDCLGVLRGTHRREKKKHKQGQGQGQGHREEVEYKSEYDCHYPDLILTNGPGTGVIMVLASLLLLFVGLAPVRVNKHTSTSTSPSPSTSTNTSIETNAEETETQEVGSMRSIYIESWARVKTLSLSGRILRFLAGRVLVQWRGVGDLDRTVLQTGEKGEMGKGDEEGEGVGEGTGGSRSRSMRIRKREREEIDSRKDGDRYAGSIWPRKTEYIGAVVT